MLIPEMDTKSNLISDDQRKLLYRHLPPRIQVLEEAAVSAPASQDTGSIAMTDCMIQTSVPFFGSV
jgi:hypothetical protein